ncbi:uncharacterized protein N7500_002309 [Penicillium coprophilum]|uniref:uncharacterized protein n=1 Tax=Penicillium coprophilum TaxID=36646 RepID=UPI00238932C5|nr:uncharacterized protein N7500_002309 [Penicillium coprophilum]KAJ5169526.1 hypothetical protein N7500_002309 [Penicillium coprophilum]
MVKFSSSLAIIIPCASFPFYIFVASRSSMSHLGKMEVAWPQLFKSDFLNPDVLNAANPHPVWGYAHGPIPNNNPDWKLKSTTANGSISITKATAALAADGPQAPMVTLNCWDTIVCDILVKDTQLCGASFSDPGSFPRHVRLHHRGAVHLPSHGPLNIEEATAAHNAIKRWILMGGWRDALYLKEPRKNVIAASRIGFYCDTLEEIARTDAQFAAEYGSQFHRSGYRDPSLALDYVGIPLEDAKRKDVDNTKCRIHLPANRLIPLGTATGGDDFVKSSRCEKSTQTEPVFYNDLNVNHSVTSGSGPDYKKVSKFVFEVDSEDEDQEEWPVDAVTDIFAGLYLPSSRLDAAYGPMPGEMD